MAYVTRTDRENRRVDTWRDDAEVTSSQRRRHDDVADDAELSPRTPPLLWQRPGLHTTSSWQPAAGTRSRSYRLVSVPQTKHLQWLLTAERSQEWNGRVLRLSVRECVFKLTFFRFQKNVPFYVFWNDVMSESRKKFRKSLVLNPSKWVHILAPSDRCNNVIQFPAPRVWSKQLAFETKKLAGLWR